MARRRTTCSSSSPRRPERRGIAAARSWAADPTRLRMEETMRPTTATHDNVFDFQALLRPGTVFEHPKDVVMHPSLTLAEKRAILASWASDASAIASCPALRAPEGLKMPVSIDAILEALCELDGGPRNPPGGTPKRQFSTARALVA